MVGVLPGSIVVGLGIGLIFGSATATATERVRPAEAGVAAALVNAVQQVGGALGTALLMTIATQTTSGLLPAAGGPSEVTAIALVAGYDRAFLVAAGIFALMAIVCAVVLPRTRTRSPSTANVPSGATTSEPNDIAAQRISSRGDVAKGRA